MVFKKVGWLYGRWMEDKDEREEEKIINIPPFPKEGERGII
jgi:hypothetical protein